MDTHIVSIIASTDHITSNPVIWNEYLAHNMFDPGYHPVRAVTAARKLKKGSVVSSIPTMPAIFHNTVNLQTKAVYKQPPSSKSHESIAIMKNYHYKLMKEKENQS